MAGNKNSGRKPKPNSKRTSIHIDNRVREIIRGMGQGSMSLGVELLAYKSIYDEVFHNGYFYVLTDEAQPTSRQLSAVRGAGWYDDAKYFEVSAPALDYKGETYEVYWIFEKMWYDKENPFELDDYDYDQPHRVEKRD